MNSHIATSTRSAAVALATAVLALGLAGCGTSDSSAPSRIHQQAQVITPAPVPPEQQIPCHHRPCMR
jgi:outer membrane protein assembly factor BamE (lipoprotein component of BamABCDE complex)